MYILFVVYTVYVYSHLIYIRLICLSADELWSLLYEIFTIGYIQWKFVRLCRCLLLCTMFSLTLYLAELDKRNELPYAISNSIK